MDEEIIMKIGKLIREYTKTVHELAKHLCDIKRPDYRADVFFLLLGYDEIDEDSERYRKTKEWLEKVCKGD